MTKPVYSNFTINANKGAARDPKLPTMRGEATILDIDGTPVPFEHAVWGPNAPTEQGKREYSLASSSLPRPSSKPASAL